METVAEKKMKRQDFFGNAKNVRDKMEKFCSSKAFIFIVALITFVFHALALDFWGITLSAGAAELQQTVATSSKQNSN